MYHKLLKMKVRVSGSEKFLFGLAFYLIFRAYNIYVIIIIIINQIYYIGVYEHRKNIEYANFIFKVIF